MNGGVIEESEIDDSNNGFWNYIGRITLNYYVGDQLKKAQTGSLEPKDFLPISVTRSYRVNMEIWAEKLTFPASAWGLLGMYPFEVAMNLLFGWACFGTQIFTSYFLFQRLASFLTDPTQRASWGWILICCMLVTNFAYNLLTCGVMMWGNFLGIRLKNGFQATVYRKSMALKNLDDAGLVNNMLSNDSERMFELGQYVIWIPVGIPVTIVSIVLVCVLFGWAAVVGTLVLIAGLLAIARWLGGLVGFYRGQALPFTDKRVGALSELLNSIQFVKMYTYEGFFADKIANLRDQETRQLGKSLIVLVANTMCVLGTSVLPPLVTFLIYIGMGNELTAAPAFTAISLWNSLWLPLVMMVQGLNKLGGVRPCLKRLDTLMQKEDLDMVRAHEWTPNLQPGESPFVQIEGAQYQNRTYTLKDVNLDARAGQFIMLAGPVGSGKTTALLGILGQYPRIGGQCSIKGSFAYVPQTAFIMNGSVQENILFGLPFDASRYAMSLETSCLQDDLGLLRDGDQTMIGEKGVNLSGGQKQRVAVARALYVNADIYILDDVLSALDARVGRQVFMGLRRVLKDKVVIFANHQLQFAPMVDRVYVLHDDCIVESGSCAELLQSGRVFPAMYREYQASAEETSPDLSQQEGSLKNNNNSNKTAKVDAPSPRGAAASNVFQLVKEEKVVIGNLGAATLRGFLGLLGPWFCVILAGFVAVTALRAYAEFHLAAWVSSEDHSGWSFGAWAGVYAFAVIGTVLGMFVVQMGLQIRALSASKNLHNNVVRQLLNGTMNFFHSNPVGRILNRLTKDVDICDTMMPFALDSFVTYFILSMSVFIACAVVFPLSLATFPFLVFTFVLLARYLRNGTRQFRRMDGVLRSFVFSALSTTMNGLTTIRAFNAMDRFESMFRYRCDNQCQSSFCVWVVGRWFGVRLDILVTLYVFLISLIAVATRFNQSGALGALAVTFSIRLAANFQWSVRNGVDAESHMTAVERLLEYTDPAVVPMEPQQGLVKAPENWPTQGRVEFDHVSMRYRPELPLVLHDVSLKVPGGSSLGIVGRTGAGKSSIVNALLRLTPVTQGSIRIDGVSIDAISLQELRGRISVIPQEPVVFSGTARSNLDPFNSKTNAEILQVLGQVQLCERIPDLDAPLGDLSHGERNLLAVARALLRGAKVLIEDEATASVDTVTDGIIQKVMSQLENCTRITIAHRLQTVIGSDLVMVLDAGSISEVDSPNSLLERGDSAFRSLVLETGESSSRRLINVAKEKSRVSMVSLRSMRGGGAFHQADVPLADDDEGDLFWSPGIADDFEFFSVPLPTLL